MLLAKVSLEGARDNGMLVGEADEGPSVIVIRKRVHHMILRLN